MPEKQKELEYGIKVLQEEEPGLARKSLQGLCSIAVIGVTKQTEPSSGSALDYKQQVPFLDQGKNITCSNHFPKYLALA